MGVEMLQVAIILAALLVGGVVAVLAQRAFHRSGRYGLHLRRPGSTAWLTRASVQPSPEEVHAMPRGYDRSVSMARSPLLRVIGVGAVQTSDGITDEFISIELREAGGRGFVRVHSSGPYRPQWKPPERPREPPPPGIQDDLGTEYTVAWSATGAGGADDRSEATAEFLFAPAPPSGARRLEVSITQVDPSGDRQRPEPPPWVFDVPL